MLEHISYFFKEYEFYFRIIISAILGFLIGLDRSSKHKPAGLKTYTFVSVSCALITIVSIQSAVTYSEINIGIRMDPMRLAAQIVSGLGFLGAGVILKDGLQVKGLTSASMIFFVGAVGIGIGAGLYGIVIFAALTTFVLSEIAISLEKREIANIGVALLKQKKARKKD